MKLLRNRTNDNLQYEFLPSALEIIETPSSPFGRIIIWLIVTLLAIALVWSYFGKIDVIATTQGKVIPVGNVKTIQPASQGIITSIRVSEGEHVKQGQLLIELDSSLATSEMKSTEKSLATARLERDIMKKTLAGEDITELVNQADIPDDTKQDLLHLTDSKASAAQVRRQLLSSSISQAQSQLSNEQQAQRSLEESIQSGHVREQDLRNQIAQASGSQKSNSQAQLDDLTRQIGGLESTLMSQKQRVTQARAGIDQAKGNLSSFNAENTSTTSSSVVDQDKHIAELEDLLMKAKKNIEQLSIKAPVGGTILSLASNTIGGVVTAAQPLIVIVPENTPLIVEATLQNKDVGFVKVGQKVAVKVDTYSFQRYGYLNGTVKSISADAFDDQKQGSVYKMKVTLDDAKTSKDNTIDVSPGMSVTSEITTDKRRIIEFFLDPLVTHTDTSLKVR